MRSVFVFILTLTIVGCSRYNKTSINASQIIDFKKDYIIQNAEQLNWDISGIQDFLIYDSLFIYSKRDKNGCIGVIDKSGNKYGDYISIGNGPNELLFPPWVNRSVMYDLNGCLYMGFLDQMRGIYYKMDITKSLDLGRTIMEIEYDSIPSNGTFIPINDSTLFYCNINTEKTKRQRIITINRNIKDSHHLDILNNKFIEYGQDPNILSSIIKYSKKNDLFVEISLMMNTIYLYDTNGEFFKTIYIGKNIDNERVIQRQKMGQRVLTFTNLRLYDNFWGVIYIDETLEQYDSGINKPSRILLFDWNGEPLANMILENKISSFDIDIQGKYLYTLDNRTERLCRYSIYEILKDID